MARVTVEDCVDKVENRFELVLLASHRARMIASGAPLTIDRDNDKNPVVALREIADQTVAPEDLKEVLGSAEVQEVRAGQAIIAHGTLGYLPLNPRELAMERTRLGLSHE